MQQQTRQRWNWQAVIRWLPRMWVLLLAVYVLAGTLTVPFHGDESTTLWMSRDFHYLAAGDVERVLYRDPPLDAAEQHLRLVAAPLTRYLYGLAGAVLGYDAAGVNEQWVWGAGWDWNHTNGHVPPDDLLAAARWISAAFTAAGVALIYVIGRRLGGTAVAYLASLFYALHPAILLNGRRAMMEGPLLFFSLLTVLAGILLLQKRTWWAAFLLGTAAGLAVAAKHTNAVIVVAVLGALGLYAVIDSLRSDESDGDDIDPATVGPYDPYFLLVTLTTAGALAALIFYALNPVMWQDPANRLADMVAARGEILAAQEAAFGSYDGVGDRLAGWLRQVFVAAPQYYEVPDWAGYIAGEIATYEASPWAGVRGAGIAGGVLLAGLMVMGLRALFRAPLRRETRLLAFAWVLPALLVPLIVNPFEWQRYYLMAYPAVGLLAAFGTVDVGRALGRVYRKRRRA